MLFAKIPYLPRDEEDKHVGIMSVQTILWIVFGGVVILLLALDLGVFQRKNKEISMREAFVWTGIWIGVALLFWLGIMIVEGHEPGINFLTGYLVEKALSVDNLFVFLIIFSYFGIPSEYQHKILFWGIIGALITRAIFIFLGIALISYFHWTIYILAAFLVYTGLKLIKKSDNDVEPGRNPLIRFAQHLIPVTSDMHGGRFFSHEQGRLVATPLFICLIAIESTDVVFATDSIPAILGITTDPFIVYSSNIFAILGLRALYFALVGFMKLFRFLHYGLAGILVFIGIKMLLMDLVKIPVFLSLGVVGLILGISVALSLLIKPAEETSA